MWLVTYLDGSTETYTDSSLDLVVALLDDHKIVVKIENLTYK